MKKLGLALSAFLICGCIAGGVFITHQKPDIYFDKATEFTFELSVNAGNARKAYQRTTLIYQLNDSSEQRESMSIDTADKNHVIFKATIRPIQKSTGNNSFKYYFEYYGDKDIYYYPQDARPLIIDIK
jgi:hypothetical protein